MITNYEGWYSGGYSSLSPTYGLNSSYIGFRIPSSQISSPTSIQTANQLGEVISRIREGVRNVEIQTIQPEIFEQIPKEHLKEINALTKLTGVKASVHAPLIDPAGFDSQRGYQGEIAREESERRLWQVIERSHDLDPEGNIPIVIHSTGAIPGAEFSADTNKKPGEEGRYKEQKLIAINRDTGEMIPLKREIEYHPLYGKSGKGIKPGEELQYEKIPSKQIDSVNASDWDQKLTNLTMYEKHADETLGNAPLILEDHLDKPRSQVQLDNEQENAYRKLQKTNQFLENVQMTFHNLFDKAYQYGTEEQKKALRKLAEEYQKRDQDIKRSLVFVDKKNNTIEPTIGYTIAQKKLIEDVLINFRGLTTGGSPEFRAPELYQDVEKFAMDRAADTFGSLAFKSYKTFGKSAPMIAVENLYPGMAFAKGEQMAELIKKSINEFVDNAVKPKEKGGLGMDKKEAEKQAGKLIGITWDVGHLNMFKRFGFTDEDVARETEKVAKLVKHVHITDNFGHSDSHLPPGMGNVPLKKHLEILEKAGALKGAMMPVEAGGFVQHFKQSPHSQVLSAFGSPVYSMEAAPYWNQARGMTGNYFGSPLAQLPERYFSTYGGGFSGLPLEVGGQIPGTQSRFAGTPNA